MYDSNINTKVLGVNKSSNKGVSTEYNNINYKTFSNKIKLKNATIGLTSDNVIKSFIRVLTDSKYKSLIPIFLKLISEEECFVGVTDYLLIKNIPGLVYDSQSKYFYFFASNGKLIILFYYIGKDSDNIPILDFENALEDLLLSITKYFLINKYDKFMKIFKNIISSYYIKILTLLQVEEKDMYRILLLILIFNKGKNCEYYNKDMDTFLKAKKLEQLAYVFNKRVEISDGEFNNDLLLPLKDAITSAARSELNVNVSRNYALMTYDISYVIFKFLSANFNDVEVQRLIGELND